MVLLKILFLTHLAFAKPIPFKVILDAGHGGRDGGAVAGKVREADIALSISKQLAVFLINDPSFEVYMTRKSNRYVSLKRRANLANRIDGELFVSIHANSSVDKRAKGAEFYIQNQLPAEEESLFLAAAENQKENLSDIEPISLYTHLPDSKPRNLKPDIRNILEDLSRNHRIRLSQIFAEALIENWNFRGESSQTSLRQAPFFLVSNLRMPSVLVELGFLSHPEDANLLINKKNHKLIANQVYRGIIRYKESLDKYRKYGLD